jgi:hypothetical protein
MRFAHLCKFFLAYAVTFSQFKNAWEDGLKESIQKHVLAGETMVVPDCVA